MFCPDRILDFTGLGSGVTAGVAAAPTVSGFTLMSTTTGTSGVLVGAGTSMIISQCVAFNINQYGFLAADGGNLRTDAKCAAVKCSWGFSATRNSYLNADNTYASDSTNFAYACVAAYVSANGAVATQNVTGFLVQDCGTLYAAGGGTSHNSFTGVQALCYALYTQLA